MQLVDNYIARAMRYGSAISTSMSSEGFTDFALCVAGVADERGAILANDDTVEIVDRAPAGEADAAREIRNVRQLASSASGHDVWSEWLKHFSVSSFLDDGREPTDEESSRPSPRASRDD